MKYYLEQSVTPDDSRDIPEDVIRAFIVKIVVHEHGYDWYLRFNPDEPPTSITVDGKRKCSAKVSSLCSPQHRLQLTKEGNKNPLQDNMLARVSQSSFVRVQEFSIDLGEAKAYLYSYSTKHRIHRWENLNISIFL